MPYIILIGIIIFVLNIDLEGVYSCLEKGQEQELILEQEKLTGG